MTQSKELNLNLHLDIVKTDLDMVAIHKLLGRKEPT